MMNCDLNKDILDQIAGLEEAAEGSCPVDRALQAAALGRMNHCGKSVMCRNGITQLWEIIHDISIGKGKEGDLELLEELAGTILDADSCELASRIAGLVRTSLEEQKKIWKEHFIAKRCSLGVCVNLKAPATNKAAKNRKKFSDRTQVDVVVVGGGMSGLAAAAQAAELGLSVICIEKSGTTGGAANMGMAFFAVESKYQRDQMDPWTKDDAFNDFMEYTHWKADAATVRRWFNMSAGTVEWIEEKGVEFLGAYKYFQDSHATQHMVKLPGSNKPVERQATYMIKKVTEFAVDHGVEFRFYTSAARLIMEDGRAIGVAAVDKDGREYEIYADAVIVGTGGIGNNVEMIEKYMGWKWGRDMFTFRIPGIDGDGINMVWDAGGAQAPISMEMIYNTPGTTDVFKTLSETMRQPSTIMVNIEGKRVTNERIMNNTTFTGNTIMAQTGHRAFTIMGQYGIDYLKKHGLDYITYHHGVKDLDKFEYEMELYFSGAESAAENSVFSGESGIKYRDDNEEAECNFWVCDSLEEVAQVTGINYENLKQTIDRYNFFCGVRTGKEDVEGTVFAGDLTGEAYTGGYDADFLKPARYLRPIIGDKYYVARHFPSGYGTLGGIKVNCNMEVISMEGKVMPGLYGCGTDAAGVFAGEYCFYNPGSTMSWAINSGRIAAIEACGYLTKQ